MKDFITPEIEDISELTEGVYADSSSAVPTATPTPVPSFTYWIQKEWTNHDSGHFSCAKVIVHVTGGARHMNSIEISFGLPVKYIKDGVSYNQSQFSMSDRGGVYTFKATHLQNDTEDFHFGFNNIFFQNDDLLLLRDGDESCSYKHFSGSGPEPLEGISVSVW